MIEIPKAYNPREAESKHYDRWERIGCFKPEINEDPNAPKYSIVIPPPNVTGSLHMGHALQHTLMDILCRRRRMQGYRTLWLPGTDHAGISVQRKVVEKLRQEEGKTPQEIGREEFLKRAWAWKEKYGNEILMQMRREGASVDWTRFRFTMDESLSRAVREVFVRLYEEGWIYRGKRIVNWCPKDKTVLSDLEVREETDKNGKLYYLQYPIKDSNEKITVATTRPETMLGDTAVAVNPNDERYKHLIGKTILLPLTGREIPIIADEYVDPEFGTGAVKVTPAHDPNDYEIGLRHSLPQLLIMDEDAKMSEAAGPEFAGLDRFEARKKVIARFEELGLLEKIEDHETPLPVCERCKTVIEPFLSEQWFVKMNEMRDLALNLIRNENSPRFVPEVPHKKVYISWLENIKDWTVSRQLWWGHQIPAWYDQKGNVYVARSFEEAAEKAGTRELIQDQDVLDTWFSSALWAFSTFGWNGEVTETEDLETFLPTDVLVTGRDIIFLWVSRMVMTTLKFVGKRPFEDVLVTGTVLGRDGKPMSKSRGNGVDPLEMFDKYGVDATRIYLAAIATGADIRWSDNLIETYRNFANKIWNASRFCLMNSDGAAIDLDSLSPEDEASIADRWIISKLNRVTLQVNEALEQYQFHEAVSLLYHFFWHDFCDWYIEFVKDQISSSNEDKARHVRTRILTILEQSLRLLHPFMPFITEEIWQMLPGVSSKLHNSAYKSTTEATIMLADYPSGNASLIDEKVERQMQMVIELISRVRNIRAEMQIKPSDKVKIYIVTSAQGREVLKANESQILKLAKAERMVFIEKLEEAPKASARAITADMEIAVPLEGLIDFGKEIARLENQLRKHQAEYEKLRKQLENPDFVEKAPIQRVEQVRSQVSELETKIRALIQNLESLK